MVLKVSGAWENSEVSGHEQHSFLSDISFQSTNRLIADEIVPLKSEKRKIDCECMPNCDNSNYFVQSVVR